METEHMEKLFTLALEDGNQSAFATSMPVITQLLDALSQSQMTFAVRHHTRRPTRLNPDLKS
jgi:hypothetical protein